MLVLFRKQAMRSSHSWQLHDQQNVLVLAFDLREAGSVGARAASYILHAGLLQNEDSTHFRAPLCADVDGMLRR